FIFLGLKSFFPTTIVISTFSYLGIWKLFMLFTRLYSEYTKQIAIAVLFIPSFVFWGSGIMKDTFIVSSVCWVTYNFYKVFIKRERVWLNLAFLLLNFWII